MVNNPKGNNQHGVKDYPPDDALRKAFTDYAKENNGAGLSSDDQRQRLFQDFGLQIGKDTFFRLKTRLGVPSVRKNKKLLSETQKVQAVVDIKQNDVQGRWGVNATKQRLANDGVWIGRDELRTILHDQFDHEFESRFVGKQREKSHRVALYSLGPWHEEHSDGHEKLAEQGLNIGKGIHLPIYGSKDQFSSWVHALVLMPNIRKANSIAHYYLDLVEGRNFTISLQLTTDLGSEVNEMHKIHQALRDEAAPGFASADWPASKKMPSTKNTPIESFWRWHRNGEGHNIKQVILEGVQEGFFVSEDLLHRDLFYWIWVPLVQRRLDDFRAYWNYHKLTGNSKKANPYGSSPKNMLVNPQSVRVTAKDCSIRVNPATLYHLREAYGGEAARDAAYRFYSAEFAAAADSAYVDLGLPGIELENAWDVFRAMRDALNDLPLY